MPTIFTSKPKKIHPEPVHSEPLGLSSGRRPVEPAKGPFSPLSPLSPKTPPPKSKSIHHLLSALAYKPRHLSFETQRKQEEIILLIRRHWLTNLGWILLTTLLLFLPLFFPLLPLLSLLPARFQIILTLGWYLFTSAFVLENFLNWYFNVCLVTNERVVDIDFFSLIYKEISDARIENIQDVTYSMGGLFRALFNYGDVLIQTAAEHAVFEFEAIPNPAWVVQKINEVIERKQG